MDPSIPHQSPASLVLGPLIVANLINWGFCGALSFQLYVNVASSSLSLFSTTTPASDKSNSRNFPSTASGSALPPLNSKRRRRRPRILGWRSASPSNDDVTVNPWTVSIAGPPTLDHANSSSFDPYAPSTPSCSPSTNDSHLDRIPRPKQNSDNGVGDFPTQRSSMPKLNTNIDLEQQQSQLYSHSHTSSRNLSRYAQLLFTLYILVCAQSLFSTAYLWRVAVDGWGTGAGPPDTSWLATVANDIFGPIIFALSLMFYFTFFLFPPTSLLRVQQQSDESLPPKSAVLRSLFILKAKFAAAQSQNVRQRNNEAPIDYNPYHSRYSLSQYGYQYGNGHVQRPPSRWQSFRSAFNRFLNTSGLTDFAHRSRTYAVPLAVSLVIILVVACGLVNGGRRLRERASVGAEPVFDGPAAVWYAGSVVLNALVCAFLSASMMGSRTTDSKMQRRRRFSPILVRATRALVESGAMQLVVSFLALVLTVAYRHSATPTTVPLAPSILLPAIYANTLVLVLTQSFSYLSPRSRPSNTSTKRTSLKELRPVVEQQRVTPLVEKKDKEEIEMTPMTGIRSINTARPEANAAQRIRFSGSGFVMSSGSGTGTNTTTNTNTNTNTGSFSETHAGMIRTAAFAFGGAVSSSINADYQQIQQQMMPPRRVDETGFGSVPPARMHMERDTLGEGSIGRQRGASAGASETSHEHSVSGYAPMNNATRRQSVSSNLSADALSLELPVFRKGKSYANVGYWADDDMWDDDESDSILSSEGDGTWDYGYSLNLAAIEREREKEEREKAAATLAGQSILPGALTVPPSTLTNLSRPQNATHNHPLRQRNSYPSFSIARHASRRRSAQPPSTTYEESEEVILDDDEVDDSDDRVGASTQPHYIRPLPPIPNIPQTLPLALKPPQQRRLMQQTLHPPDDTSVLIISGSRDPSIIEPSVYRAASVAATRASTGSLWSSFTYPKPTAFPDLDEDLQNLHGDDLSYVNPGATQSGSGFFYNSEQDHLRHQGEGESEGNTGGGVGAGLTVLALGSLDGGSSASPAHPYAAANDEDRNAAERENNRRRWRVHPLKRMVEMGRLRR